MRKSLIAVAMLVGLLASAASAFAFTFEVAGINDQTLRAQVGVDYNPLTHVADFSILNTTSTQGMITGFAFGLPLDGIGAGILSASVLASTNPSFQLFNVGAVLPNSIHSPQLPTYFDMGMGTGPNFAGGGNPNNGILLGQTATFSLLFSGPGAGNWDMAGILAALAQEQGTPFALRFQATGLNGEGSDVATPTPIPGAVWLLGSGLMGLLGLKRRRAAA
ncbi:MAG: hypothetical protein KKA55_14565 [Proteobacteria bacterium]|nr:hypothetical protein [Pseudomonadota bacterium]MBU1596743.1 hypothetical protein [Pseudomonadota bacterium]